MVINYCFNNFDFIQLQHAFYHFNIESILGISLFAVGVSLRTFSKRTLRKHYSYVLKTNQTQKQLVTYGIYKFIRHPIYLAAILYVVGFPLIFSSLYGFFVSLAFIPCLLHRICIEEKMLIEEFGQQYLNYQKCTKKLIPLIY